MLRLAHFRGASAIARAIQSEYGVAVDRHQVRAYDPTKLAFAAADRWRVFFDEARGRYLHDVTAIPIANKACRLNELQRNYEHARRAGNLVLADATLKQAGEETCGALTNERNVRVTKGAEDLTPEERRQALTEVLRVAMEQMAENVEVTPVITDESNAG